MEVRVKTCGKSARLLRATAAVDKPCGLKCHVHPVYVWLAQLRETGGRGGRQRRPRDAGAR